MSEFWVKNTTRLDHNFKGLNGARYRLESGQSGDLVVKSGGRMSAEDFENDELMTKLIARGDFIKLNAAPGAKQTLDENTLQTAAELLDGQQGQSVIMKNQNPEEETAETEDVVKVGNVSNDGSTTVMNPVSDSDMEDDTTASRIGMVKSEGGVAAVLPPEDFEANGLDMNSDDSARLSFNLKKARKAVSERFDAKVQAKVDNARELGSARLDKHRCAALTGSGKQCRNKVGESDKYCRQPQHRKLAG